MTIMTEVEEVAAKSWKTTTTYTLSEIAAKILESRHPDEYNEIREAVKRK